VRYRIAHSSSRRDPALTAGFDAVPETQTCQRLLRGQI
jgi:hypothetical protein